MTAIELQLMALLAAADAVLDRWEDIDPDTGDADALSEAMNALAEVVASVKEEECGDCDRYPCICGDGPQNDDHLEADRGPVDAHQLLMMARAM